MSDMNKLSILIPAYNEERLIRRTLERIAALCLPWGMAKEIIVVDDASTDDTAQITLRFQIEHSEFEVKCLNNPINRGKGACLHQGIFCATGDVIVVQDADLEYDPHDFCKMLVAMEESRADVVYGSRFLVGGRISTPLHQFGNFALTLFSNAFTGLRLTDVHTCYKMFRADLLRQIRLREQRFGFCPEVTAKIAQIPGLRLVEVPVSYLPRNFANGKKIGICDGFRALWCTIRYSRWTGRLDRAPDSPATTVICR